MKSLQKSLSVALLLCASTNVHAAINLPPELSASARGSDGALNVTADTEIDLSTARTGTWTDVGAGAGVYDPDKWAVVFKYSSVNIDVGRKLTFKNHPTRAPVIWIVTGDVVINGTVDLDGRTGNASYGEPGPGGYRGGIGEAAGLAGSAGFGPGGGGHACYGTKPAGATCETYGNASLLPLVGGSGGGGNAFAYDRFDGGAGGGAMFVVASGKIQLNGLVSAGGSSGSNGSFASHGSGGAIRLVGDIIAGNGRVSAGSATGGLGRIRIEANSTSGATISTVPSVPASYPPDDPVRIFPSAADSFVRIKSVQNIAAPADPRAAIVGFQRDVVYPHATTMRIEVETRNIAVDSTARGIVKVRYTPSHGEASVVLAQFASGSLANAIWIADVPVVDDVGVVQATAANSKP